MTWQNAMDGIGSRQAVDTLLDTVLQVEPMHPGAHHYRIHLWDGVKPIRAEKSAALYAKTAPGIAHAWHMPGHTYTGLKRYADAAYQQEGSARVDHAYMIRDRVMPFEIHNYAHNNQWLCTSLSHIGRVHDAIAVARNLVEQPRDPQKNGPNDGGSPQRSGRARWAELLTRYELWDELIEATTSGALDWSNIPYRAGAEGIHPGPGLRRQERSGQARRADRGAQETVQRRGEDRARGAGRAPAPGPGRDRPGLRAVRESDLDAARGSGPRPSGGPQLWVRRKHRPAGRREEPQPGSRPGRPGRDPSRRRQRERGPRGLQVARAAGPLGRPRSAGFPPARAVSSSRWKAEGTWTSLGPSAGQCLRHRRDRHRPDRPEDARPPGLEPVPRRAVLANRHGRRPLEPRRLIKGKNVLVIFFLGGKCAHCMQQLQTFGKEYEALKKLNVETVAISTDDLDAAKALKNNKDGIKFPMPILADPKLELFKLYRAYDDFENQPLHGTFLIDAQGNVRFQRISADPFLEVEFIKAEAARVNRIVDVKNAMHRDGSH